jgi:hypothetical protein
MLHCVLPAGQPQKPRALLMQATPLAQQFGPHGVLPLGQQHPAM